VSGRDSHLYLGDCREVLPRLPAGSVDLVVTDPPYNIASDHAVTMVGDRLLTTAQAWGAWDRYSAADYRALLEGVFRQLHRLLRAGGQVYWWCGSRGIGDTIEAAEGVGFRFRAKLVAVKARPQPAWRQGNWRSAYEECLYFSKGAPTPFHFLGQRQMRNAWLLPHEYKASTHPTEKRPAMIAPLIRVSSRRGEVVLDPFLGSGTTAVVARAMGRRFIGIEREGSYLEMARRRLAA